MELIKLFFFGAAGYLLVGLFDAAQMKHLTLLKLAAAAGFPLTAAPYAVLFLTRDSPLESSAALVVGLLSACFALLLIYSVLIEIPLRSKPGELYCRGTYSFSRHPGVIWYTGINILTAVYFQETGVTLICFALVVCNIILVVVEDTILFPRMFPAYREYRETTPFILPIRLKKLWRTDND